MAVRVKVVLRSLKGRERKEIEAVALANAGFETEDLEIIVPKKLAEEFGLWRELPEGSRMVSYEAAGGQKVKGWLIPEAMETKVVTSDKSSSWVKANVLILEMEREVVISDKLIDAHELDLEKVGEGLWRFRGEENLRKSEEPEYW